MFSKRVYLDYASTTPVDPTVFRKMKQFFTVDFYNAQALYTSATKVKKVLQEARSSVARICGTKENEVIFTGSGTESNNLAVIGAVRAFQKKFPNKRPKVITTEIEHVSVLKPLEKLFESGEVDIVYIPTRPNGQIEIEDFKRSLDENVVLITVMLANNEIGTILPVRKISSEVKKFKNKVGRIESDYPYIHSDASQAPCFIDVNLNRLGIDLLTMDGSKIYGPKGVGALVAKKYVPLQSVLFGGNQEFSLRPGTENVALIVGFSEALKLTELRREEDSKYLTELRDYFIEELLKISTKISVNGTLENRLPNNVNVCIPGLNSEFAVIKLDLLGIECSSATVCKNITDETRSYVVDALGNDCGASSLRFSLGRQTKKGDIDVTLKAIKKVLS